MPNLIKKYYLKINEVYGNKNVINDFKIVKKVITVGNLYDFDTNEQIGDITVNYDKTNKYFLNCCQNLNINYNKLFLNYSGTNNLELNDIEPQKILIKINNNENSNNIYHGKELTLVGYKYNELFIYELFE